MKRILAFIFFLSCAFYSFAQFQLESINCIILIDGKLPRNDGRTWGFVEYNNEFNQKDTADFYYYIPTIRFKTTDFKKLQSLSDTTTVTVHIEFQEYQKCTRKRYHYSSRFPLEGLLHKDYIVFSITNFNKKRGTYYFNYEASYEAYIIRKPKQEGYSKRCRIFHDTMPCSKPKKR